MALDWPAIERLFFDFFLLFSPQKAPKFASRAHSDNGAETTPPPHTHTHTKMPKKGKRTHPKKKVFQPKKSKGTRTTARRPFGRSPTKVETEKKKKRKNSFFFFFFFFHFFFFFFVSLFFGHWAVSFVDFTARSSPRYLFLFCHFLFFLSFFFFLSSSNPQLRFDYLPSLRLTFTGFAIGSPGPGFTGFCSLQLLIDRLLLGFTGFYPSFTEFSGFYLV